MYAAVENMLDHAMNYLAEDFKRAASVIGVSMIILGLCALYIGGK